MRHTYLHEKDVGHGYVNEKAPKLSNFKEKTVTLSFWAYTVGKYDIHAFSIR